MLAAKIALYTGLRRGELCALKWKNVDFKSSTMGSRAAIGHTDNEFYIKGPKSIGSQRAIPNCPKDLMRRPCEAQGRAKSNARIWALSSATNCLSSAFRTAPS